MEMTGYTENIDICNEIVDCLADHGSMITGDTRDQKLKHAEEYLRDAFTTTGGSIEKPTEDGIKNVLKLLAAKELKSGKKAKTIAENFIRIAKRFNR